MGPVLSEFPQESHGERKRTEPGILIPLEELDSWQVTSQGSYLSQHLTGEAVEPGQ